MGLFGLSHACSSAGAAAEGGWLQQPAAKRSAFLLQIQHAQKAQSSGCFCCLQADDEDAAQQALAPARAAVQAQQHKAAGFSEHQKAAAKQAPFLLRFSGAWIHTAMLTTEVSMLEKAKQYQPAVDLLQSLLGAPFKIGAAAMRSHMKCICDCCDIRACLTAGEQCPAAYRLGKPELLYCRHLYRARQ